MIFSTLESMHQEARRIGLDNPRLTHILYEVFSATRYYLDDWRGTREFAEGYEKDPAVFRAALHGPVRVIPNLEALQVYANNGAYHFTTMLHVFNDLSLKAKGVDCILCLYRGVTGGFIGYVPMYIAIQDPAFMEAYHALGAKVDDNTL